jgi:hypothetical protein
MTVLVVIEIMYFYFRVCRHAARKSTIEQEECSVKRKTYFFYCLNKHAPLHSSNTTCFIVHFRYLEYSDYVGQWIPFTGVIVTPLPTCTYKGNIYNCHTRTKLMDFKNIKMILGASRLFLVYLPVNSRTLWHCAWIFLFVYLVWRTDTVNGLRFDLRFHRGSLLSLEFWSGGDKTWMSIVHV